MYPQLLLASSSRGRQELLHEAQIHFRVIAQYADERSYSWDMPVDQLVLSLAALKMEHAIFPDDITDNTLCIVTADTLVQDSRGIIYGKPDNSEDARVMIQALCDEKVRIVTGMRVERRTKDGDVWVTDKVYEVVDETYAVFAIPESWIAWFIDRAASVHVAGAVIFDGVGLRFAQYMQGSPSTVRGLPIYQLQLALEQLGFFEAHVE